VETNLEKKKTLSSLSYSNPGQTLVMLAPWWRAASFVVLWLFAETFAMPVNPANHGS
jgi:hypothetical protein